MYECFECGERAVIWNSDYDFEACGLAGDGIVHDLTCTNCGARITYYVTFDDKEIGADGECGEEAVV